jgi:hypothetical protein
MNDREKAQGGPQEAAPPAPTPDISAIRRARWVRNKGKTMYGLYAREKDGGALLATITERPLSYDWQAGNRSGSHTSLYGAQKAARRALREVGA